MNLFERLRLRQGEQPTDRHIKELSARVDGLSGLGGVRVRETKLPWGTIRNYDGGGGTFTPEAFAPRIIRGGFKTRVKFKHGLIAGIEPTINGEKISRDPKTGRQPELVVNREDFNSRLEAYIYIRLTFHEDWTYNKVEMVVQKEVPVQKPYEAWKLALILYRNRSIFRALHSNVQHLAVARKPGGLAVHLFWSGF